MSSLLLGLGQLGMMPIECPYDNPGCLGGWSGIFSASDAVWQATSGAWGFNPVPPMQTVHEPPAPGEPIGTATSTQPATPPNSAVTAAAAGAAQTPATILGFPATTVLGFAAVGLIAWAVLSD